MPARPYVGAHACPARVGEGCGAERIARTEVDPERMRRSQPEDVVCARSPVHRRMRPAPFAQRSTRAPVTGRRLRRSGVVSRGAALRSRPSRFRRSPLAGVRAREPGWNRLPQDHRAPASIGSVVPVAVCAAVQQEDFRSTRAQRGQRVEERLGEELRRARVVTVEQDEQPPAVARRNDEDLVQVAMDTSAVQGEVDESSSASRVVTAGRHHTRRAPSRRRLSSRRG